MDQDKRDFFFCGLRVCLISPAKTEDAEITSIRSNCDNNATHVWNCSVWPRIVGVTRLICSLKVTERIFSRYSKYFVDIKKLLCWNLMNKYAMKIRCDFSIWFTNASRFRQQSSITWTGTVWLLFRTLSLYVTENYLLYIHNVHTYIHT
jgi:hypothetical protein